MNNDKPKRKRAPDKLTNEQIAEYFLTHVGNHYNFIKRYFSRQKQFQYIFNDDAFQTSIVKAHDKIASEGFYFPKGITQSGASFLNYLYIIVRNEILQPLRDGKEDIVDFNVECEHSFQLIYHEQEYLEKIEKHIYENNLLNDIFDYVQVNYSAKDAGIFKFYFYNDISYSQIKELTGWSIGYIFNTIKKIKIDVKEQFKVDIAKGKLF